MIANQHQQILQQPWSDTASDIHATQFDTTTIINKDEYNLVNKIYQMIKCIPLQINLHHVKGHHDQDKSIKELPYPARLNIECNTWACITLKTFPLDISPHPSLPSSYPHLQIQNQTIICQIPKYLHEAASLPSYHLYLTNKFNWGPNIPQMIEWRVIKFSMHKLNSTDQTRICKIIHKW